MSPRMATRHAVSVRHVGASGIEELPGNFRERPVWLCGKPCVVGLKLFVTAVLCACRGDVVVHPPPAEERWVSPFPEPLDSWVEMRRPDIERYLVSGVWEVHSETKRWVEKRGVFRILVPPYYPLKFHMDFELAAELVEKAGEVRLNIDVNGERFGTFSYDTPGRHRLEQAVKEGSLPWETDSEIAIEIIPAREHRWKDFELGFLVTSLGFRL